MRKKVMLIGSSMTQRCFSLEHHGWGASLANWYATSADVLNRGAGGYNSKWIRNYLHKILDHVKPDLTVLFVGNNDSIVDKEPQYVSIEEYRQNILYILEHLYVLKENMAVVLVTPTRVNEQLKPLHNDFRRSKYADVLRDIVLNKESTPFLANKHLALLDLWIDDPQNGYYSITTEDLHDGMHLGKSGNKKLYEALRYCITANFPFLSPDLMPRKRRRGTESDMMKVTKQMKQLSHNNQEESSTEENGESSKYNLPKVESLQMTVPLWHELI